MATLQGQEVHGPSSARPRREGAIGHAPRREGGTVRIHAAALAKTLVGGVAPMHPRPASHPHVEDVDVRASALDDAAGHREPPHRVGSLLADKYQLLSPIGAGGMGMVWRARNVVLDVDVALKVIRREINDPSILDRFMLEARASARLQHPSIVCVQDYGSSARGEPFMVMELLQGTSLEHRLQMEGRIDALEAVTLLLPIAAGLSAAHQAGVVHRDIKPDNIFLAQGGDGWLRPVIMDFGIAKLRQESTHRPLTCPGALVGTPEYMSPEQLAADCDIDARSDVWGFCVVLYEVIAGRRPFDGASQLELAAAIVGATPKSLCELGVADERLSAIVRRGLAGRPDDRWGSMHELGIALAQWAADAGKETDAAGVTLARWSGVALGPRRRSGGMAASSPAGAASLATSVPAGPVRRTPARPTLRAPAKPRRLRSTALLAGVLGVAGLGLGGWATRPVLAESMAEPRAGSTVTEEVPVATAESLRSPPPAAAQEPVAPSDGERGSAPSALPSAEAQPETPPRASPPPALPRREPGGLPPSGVPETPNF
jgi:serine/threonine-protein kinase